MKLIPPNIKQKVYEIKPEGNPGAAIEAVITDIRAAADLGLTFEVLTVNRKAFRHGGNVTKADVWEYRVTVGKFEDETKR